MARTNISINSILGELCLHGKDILVSALQRAGCLKDARLAFRALRDTVDGSLITTTLRVKSDTDQLIAAGQRFPLWRWPRLTHLRIRTDNATLDAAESLVLALPFTGQPPDCLRRITHLVLEGDYVRFAASSPAAPRAPPGDAAAAALLASLLQRLTGLRSLATDLPLPLAPLQQQLLHDALASLPQLQELRLENSALAFQPAGALGDRLQVYRCAGWPVPGPRPESSSVPALDWLLAQGPRLHALRSVHLSLRCKLDEGLAGDLLVLLRGARPPGLRTLAVSCADTSFRYPGNASWRLTLGPCGRITQARQEATSTPGSASLVVLAEFVDKVLLPLLLGETEESRQQQQHPPQQQESQNPRTQARHHQTCSQQPVGPARAHLELLHLERLDIFSPDVGFGEGLAADEERLLQGLAALVHRSRRVVIGALALCCWDDRCNAARGLHVLRVLRMLPEALVFFDSCKCMSTEFQLRRWQRAAEGEEEAWREPSSATAAVEEEVKRAAVEEVADVAMKREMPTDWAALDRAELFGLVSEVALRRLELEARNGGAQRQLLRQGTAPPGHYILRLRSPGLGTLAFSPEAVEAWLARLIDVASNAVGCSPATRQSLRGSCFPYLPVPGMDTLLLNLYDLDTAEAVAAVVPAALAAARGRWSGATGVAVEVAIVPSQHGLHQRLVQAGQAFWDSGAGGSEEQRLRLLLELGAVLANEVWERVVALRAE